MGQRRKRRQSHFILIAKRENSGSNEEKGQKAGDLQGEMTG
jgi:hypothetical protein